MYMVPEYVMHGTRKWYFTQTMILKPKYHDYQLNKCTLHNAKWNNSSQSQALQWLRKRSYNKIACVRGPGDAFSSPFDLFIVLAPFGQFSFCLFLFHIFICHPIVFSYLTAPSISAAWVIMCKSLSPSGMCTSSSPIFLCTSYPLLVPWTSYPPITPCTPYPPITPWHLPLPSSYARHALILPCTSLPIAPCKSSLIAPCSSSPLVVPFTSSPAIPSREPSPLITPFMLLFFVILIRELNYIYRDPMRLF